MAGYIGKSMKRVEDPRFIQGNGPLRCQPHSPWHGTRRC